MFQMITLLIAFWFIHVILEKKHTHINSFEHKTCWKLFCIVRFQTNWATDTDESGFARFVSGEAQAGYLNLSPGPISQIPQCTSPMSHNAPFCNRNVDISVTKWCIVGYGTSALWECVTCLHCTVWQWVRNAWRHGSGPGRFEGIRDHGTVCALEHIQAWTKWIPSGKWYFQTHFFNINYCISREFRRSSLPRVKWTSQHWFMVMAWHWAGKP